MEIIKKIIWSLLIIIAVLGVWHGMGFEIGNPDGFYFKIETYPFKRIF